MEKTTLFKSNRSQAVRLPKAVALPDDVKQVEIVALGRTRIITPAGEAWDSWFDGESVSPDFSESSQGAKQGRFLMLKYMLDTNNTREFERVPGMRLSDWTIQ
jgi:antitoxin VapB